jgi:hypothetical protein
MWDEYEEPYYQPSGADDIFTEAKEKLKTILTDSIKSDINAMTEKIGCLTRENERLQKERVSLIAREKAVEAKEKNLEKDFIRNKFSELMKPLETKRTLYTARGKSIQMAKCSKCDENRKVKFTNIWGEEVLLKCSCDKWDSKFEPTEYKVFRINLYKQGSGWGDRKTEAVFEYARTSEQDERNATVTLLECYDKFNEDELKDKNQYGIYFYSKSECNKFCKYLDKKEK